MIYREVVPYLLAPTNLRVYKKEENHNFDYKQNTFTSLIVKHLKISCVVRRGGEVSRRIKVMRIRSSLYRDDLPMKEKGIQVICKLIVLKLRKH